jgi:hypothetical protein
VFLLRLGAFPFSVSHCPDAHIFLEKKAEAGSSRLLISVVFLLAAVRVVRAVDK